MRVNSHHYASGLPSLGRAPLPCSAIEAYFEVTDSETAGKRTPKWVNADPGGYGATGVPLISAKPSQTSQ